MVKNFQNRTSARVERETGSGQSKTSLRPAVNFRALHTPLRGNLTANDGAKRRLARGKISVGAGGTCEDFGDLGRFS